MTDIATLNEQQMRMAEELLFSGKRLPSFVKALFFGLFDAERVLPYPNVGDEERSRVDRLVRELNAWADEHLDPVAIDRNENIPEDVIAGLGKLGVLGCTISDEYGGLGLTQFGYCRLVEEIARRCGSTALFVNAHQSIGLKALLLFGTKEQRERWLPPLARGEALAAFALTEPNAGSDAAGVETRAVYDPARNAYVINGKKQWITNGGIADILTVMAQTTVETKNGPQDKVTAFLVTPDMPGFVVTDVALEKVGMRGTKTAKLSFENLVVPAENILGKLGAGLKMALTVLDFGRTTFGAGCTGNCKEMVERATKHAMERHQFQRPLASFGLVKEKLAKMAALVYAMDAATYLTAGLLDRGEEDFMLETAIIKVFASDCQWKICYDTMQILGGRSFFTDEPYERMMRDARLNTIGEGSNEVLRAFIAIVGMRDVGMQLKDVADSVTSPLRALGKAFGIGKTALERAMKTPAIPVRAYQLQDEAKKLGEAVRRFGFSVQRAVIRHRENIVEQQMLLDRLTNAVIALYTVTAVISKLDGLLANADGKSDAIANDLAVGKLYCTMAFETIDRSLDALFKNNDAEIYGISDRLTGYRG
ncbi:MAG: acyl-CoA dehydrogenase family protein [Candidatus Hydrogenedentes bacterium]|nr:acyl-CoA dehydrogenase family protein [Candidatus Hydrogenedentota bacterium]